MYYAKGIMAYDFESTLNYWTYRETLSCSIKGSYTLNIYPFFKIIPCKIRFLHLLLFATVSCATSTLQW